MTDGTNYWPAWHGAQPEKNEDSAKQSSVISKNKKDMDSEDVNEIGKEINDDKNKYSGEEEEGDDRKKTE